MPHVVRPRLRPCARVLALTLVAGLAAGCADRGPAGGEGEDGAARQLAYDQVWQIATHNSYWVDRATPNDLLASGTGERLLDQLLHDGVRTLEIDIHPDPSRAGGFVVHHTVPGNSVCAKLEDCLAPLRLLHHVLPHHEVVTVVLELKGIIEPTFDSAHTIDDLDRVLGTELAAEIYRPADLLDRCPAAAATTLAACAAAAGWPSVAELRGRVIVTLLGNWDDIGNAQATRDWVDYATAADMRQRAAFPMASSWKLTEAALSPRLQALVTQADLDAAFEQSAFLQIEDLTDPRIDPFLARRGVIRVDGAFAPDDQSARLARGMQLLQTDFPWITVDGAGPGTPLRALPAVAERGTPDQPGSHARLAEPADGGADLVFAYVEEDARAVTWEAAVASGVAPAPEGCLRAASGLEVGADSISVCRAKRGPGKDAERAVVRLEVCGEDGCSSEEIAGSLAGVGGVGDLLELSSARSQDGATCAQARSTDLVAVDGTPRWTAVGGEHCFARPLRFQGIALAAPLAAAPDANVALAGIALATGEGGRSTSLSAEDFDGVVVRRGDAISREPGLLGKD